MTKVVKKRSKLGVVTSILKKNQLKQRVRRGGDALSEAIAIVDNFKQDVSTFEEEEIKAKNILLTPFSRERDKVDKIEKINFANTRLIKAKKNLLEAEINLQKIQDHILEEGSTTEAELKLQNIKVPTLVEGSTAEAEINLQKIQDHILEEGSTTTGTQQDDSEQDDREQTPGKQQEPPRSDKQSCIDKYKKEYDELISVNKFLEDKSSNPFFKKSLDNIFDHYFKNNHYENNLLDIKNGEDNIVYNLIKEVTDITTYINHDNNKSKITDFIISTSNMKSGIFLNRNREIKIENQSILHDKVKILESEKLKLDSGTTDKILFNSINLANIHNILRITSKNISEDNKNLFKEQFKLYFIKSILCRLIYANTIKDKNKVPILNNLSIMFNKTEWNIRNDITILIDEYIKRNDNGKTQTGGNKSLSVNKIKEIADKLKVSHSKCKSKESIMTKIKSIDLQKLTIEQLKIYCKLFNIKDCSKCKSKKSLLLHTKSNMKVR